MAYVNVLEWKAEQVSEWLRNFISSPVILQNKFVHNFFMFFFLFIYFSFFISFFFKFPFNFFMNWFLFYCSLGWLWLAIALADMMSVWLWTFVTFICTSTEHEQVFLCVIEHEMTSLEHELVSFCLTVHLLVILLPWKCSFSSWLVGLFNN